MNIWYPVVTIFVGSEWISIVSCLITLITGIWYPSCTVFVFLENICYDLYILINRNNISDLHVGSWHALSVGFEILIWVYICHVCFWFFLNIIHCLSIWFNQGFFFKKCFPHSKHWNCLLRKLSDVIFHASSVRCYQKIVFSQCSHLYGSSPVWTLSCFFKTDNWPNSLLQNEQLYGKVPQTTRVLYSFMMNINMLV